VDKEKIGLTIREKKYIHARIIAHEVRLKRIEDYLSMPALEVPTSKQPQVNAEESPTVSGRRIRNEDCLQMPFISMRATVLTEIKLSGGPLCDVSLSKPIRGFLKKL